MNVSLSSDSQRAAQRVLRLLAEGLHPETMQKLEPTNVCQSGPVVRALFVASEVLKGSKRPSSRGVRKTPERKGSPWARAEDQELVRAFQQRLCLRSMAARHKRTQGGIATRLVRLGLVQDEAEARQLLR